MSVNEIFYKAYGLTERRFPARKYPALVYYIDLLAEKDRIKADFLRLLVMELVPDDLRAGGDYNTPRVEEALKKMDLDGLEESRDGSGEFMLGVLYARGVMCFPCREISEAERQKALEYFQRAKAKGCPAAEAEIGYYGGWAG